MRPKGRLQDRLSPWMVACRPAAPNMQCTKSNMEVIGKYEAIQQKIKRKGASIGGATGMAGMAIAIPLFGKNPQVNLRICSKTDSLQKKITGIL